MHKTIRNNLAVALVLLLTFTFVQVQAQANPSFEVRTVDDLRKIGTGIDGWTLSASYILMNDIDAAVGYNHVIAARINDPYNRTIAFNGTFDGGGHTITLNLDGHNFASFDDEEYAYSLDFVAKKFTAIRLDGLRSVSYENEGNILNVHDSGQSINFTIHFDGRAESFSIPNNYAAPVGLFGKIGSAGKVVNLRVTGNFGDESNTHIGGVAVWNYGKIENCSVKADIYGHYIGGIVAINDGGTVNSSYTTGTISGSGGVGGIAGSNENGGMVTNCFTTTNINTLFGLAGGIVGINSQSTIKNCYATGSLSAHHAYRDWDLFSANSAIGGIAGSNDNGTVENCVAINRSITTAYISDSILGRVVGSRSGTSINNYARSELIPAIAGGLYIVEPGANLKDGENVYSGTDNNQFNNQAFWSGLGWNFANVWSWDKTNNLPIIEELSAQTQNSNPMAEAPSSWAAEQINTAIAENLVPQSLQSKYTQATTRAEFCALAVALYENVTGSEIVSSKTFSDTKDINVEKAATIGVVSGTNAAGTLFSPDTMLTREQAATMLSRLADSLGKSLPKQAATFADRGSISSWAADAVGQVQASGIMGSTSASGNIFSPKSSYTREQSIVTIQRLYELVK